MSSQSFSKQTVIVFDVNETLLDLKVMQPAFTEAFGHEGALKQWFMYMLQYSMVATFTQNYHNFDTLGEAVMDMTAHAFQKSIPDEKKKGLVQMLKQLPPHPEVPEALARLQTAGYRLVTLTNSSSEMVAAQMKYANLTQYFHDLMSVDRIGLFKPHLQVYQAATYRLGAAPHNIRMVAAHAWDIAGMLAAGWKGAFVARKGVPLFSLAPKPDIIEANLAGVADKIIAMDA